MTAWSIRRNAPALALAAIGAVGCAGLAGAAVAGRWEVFSLLSPLVMGGFYFALYRGTRLDGAAAAPPAAAPPADPAEDAFCRLGPMVEAERGHGLRRRQHRHG